ncbi:MAG: methyltransferase domain-containing protein [Planctomycetes bacterium]|nr:methyltransferase domain-containing protein [Planctomycetota bacterium]
MGIPVHELPLPAFLKAIGKIETKPGGGYATRKAIDKLAITHLDKLLVIGPDAAAQAFHMAMTTRSNVTALVSNLAEALPADDAALARSCRFDVGSVEKLPQEAGAFTAVLCEATLSYLPRERQAAALGELARVLQPRGRLGLHEICWRQPPTPELEKSLREVWCGEVHPHVTRGWWDALEAAGFGSIDTEQAIISYFTRKGMEVDEVENTANVFHGAFETDEKLARFTRAYREFSEQRRYHGVLIGVATKR